MKKTFVFIFIGILFYGVGLGQHDSCQIPFFHPNKNEKRISTNCSSCEITNSIYTNISSCIGIDCGHNSYMEEAYGNIRIPIKFHGASILINEPQLTQYLNGVNAIFADNDFRIEFYKVDNITNTSETLCLYYNNCDQAPCDPIPSDDLVDSADLFSQFIHVGIYQSIMRKPITLDPPPDPCEYQTITTEFANATYPKTTPEIPTNIIIMTSICLTNNSYHILAHELGHILGLYHTFEKNVFGSEDDICQGDGITDNLYDPSNENIGSGNLMDYNNLNQNNITYCQKTKMYDVLFTCCNRTCLGEDNRPAPELSLHEACGSTGSIVGNNENNPIYISEGCHLLKSSLGPNGSNTGSFVRWELFNVSLGNDFILASYNNEYQFNTSNLIEGDTYKIKAYDLPPYANTNFSITGIPTEFYFAYFGSSNPCNLFFESFQIEYLDSNNDDIDDSVNFYCNGVPGTYYLLTHESTETETYIGSVDQWYGTITGVNNGDIFCIEESNNSSCSNSTCTTSSSYSYTNSCNPLTSFSENINGSNVTYDWSWPIGSLSIEIEESLNGNTPFDTHIINVTQPTIYTVNQTACVNYYVRARTFCGSNYSPFTNWIYVDLNASDPACDDNYSMPPTIQAANLDFSNLTNNSLNANWTRGNGENIIVTCTPCGQTISQPQDGQSYNHNNDYSQAPTVGNSRVIYKGTSTGRTVSELNANTCYLFSAYELNGSGSNALYQLVNPAQESIYTSENFLLDFDWDPIFIVEDQPVDFDWISTTGGLSIEEWTFEGGSPPTDNGNGDNIYFNNPGFYTITLEGWLGTYNEWQTVIKEIEVLSSAAFAPDFAFTNALVNPIEILPGSTLDINWTITNQGVDLGKVTWVNYYLSDDASYDASDTQFTQEGNDYQGDIVSGSNSITGSRTLNASSNIGSGTQYVLVEVESEEPLSGSPELNFSNNIIAIPFTVTALLPDLTLQNISITASTVSAGETFDAMVTFTNIGNTTCCINNPCIEYDIYLSTHNSWTDDDDFWSGSHIDNGHGCVSDNLIEQIGATHTVTRNISTLDIIESGNYFLIFVFDTQDEVSESNENNNIITVPLTVSNPNQPSTQASNLHLISKTTTTATLGWTAGDGSGAIIMAQKEGNQLNPVDGYDYAANANWSNAGSWINPESGNPYDKLRIVYEGNGNQVTVTGLDTETSWYFSLFEYNGSNSNRDYLQSNNEFLVTHLAPFNPTIQTTYLDGGISNLELSIYKVLENETDRYAFGSNGIFLKSSDDGASYKINRFTQSYVTLFDVAMINNHIVGIDHEFVYISDDGGASWQTQLINNDIATDFALFLLTEQIHFAAIKNNADEGVIYRSADAGLSWNAVHTSAGRIYGFTQNPDGSVWAAAQNGVLLKSYNEGVTWNEISHNMPTTDNFAEIVFKTSNIGYTRTLNNIYKTIDGGNNWDQIHNISGGGLRDFTALWVDENLGYNLQLFGTFGNTIQKTTDGGDTWNNHLTYSIEHNQGIREANDETILLFGLHISEFEACSLNTYFFDNDNDGFGNIESSILTCSPPAGYVDNDLDCNDSNPIYNPNNEPCPNCETEVYSVLGNPINDGVYHSTLELNSSANVTPNSNVRFKSDEIIKLTDGFKASHYFKASIDDCPE